MALTHSKRCCPQYSLAVQPASIKKWELYFDSNLSNLVMKTWRYVAMEEQCKFNSKWQNASICCGNSFDGASGKHFLKNYWSTQKTVKTPFFSKIFPRDMNANGCENFENTHYALWPTTLSKRTSTVLKGLKKNFHPVLRRLKSTRTYWVLEGYTPFFFSLG